MRYLTLEQASQEYNIYIHTLKQAINNKELKAYEFTTHIRIKKSDLNKYFRKHLIKIKRIKKRVLFSKKTDTTV